MANIFVIQLIRKNYCLKPNMGMQFSSGSMHVKGHSQTFMGVGSH
jgi:hypothetical protein